MLVFLFAALFSNYWFTVVYAHNKGSNGSSNLYTYKLRTGYSDKNSNLLTLHDITKKISFTGEVNVSSLPNFLPSKPGIIIDLKEQYLTRNYTAYINAKKQAELVNSANIAKVEIQGHNRLPNPNNDSNNNNNTSNIITTGFEGLSQVCCIPPDIQLATGSKYVMEP